MGVGVRGRPDGRRRDRPHRPPREARPVPRRVLPRPPCPHAGGLAAQKACAPPMLGLPNFRCSFCSNPLDETHSGRRGGGVRHGTGHGRRDPPGMGCGPSAVAGALARVTSGRRVEDGGAFPSRGAATLIGTASPVPLAADVRTRSLAVRLFVARNGYGAARHVRLLMCDKEAIEVQKILPFLSDTWPLCRIGRAVIRASQSCRQSCNKSQCPACGCRSHHSCTHAPQFSRSFPAREWGSVLQRQGACGQCP